MSVQKGAALSATFVLAVVAIVLGAHVLGAVFGVDHTENRATILGLPVVVLVTGFVGPLFEFRDRPGPTRADLRRAAVRSVMVTTAVALTTAACFAAVGNDIEHSSAAFWGSFAAQATAMVVVLLLLRRVPSLGPRTPSTA